MGIGICNRNRLNEWVSVHLATLSRKRTSFRQFENIILL